MNPPYRVTTVALSGIPGTGKSTALRELERTRALKRALEEHGSSFDEVRFVPEQVVLWRKNGWLKTFYDNPGECALAFQLLVFSSYVDAVQEALDDAKKDAMDAYVSRRSIFIGAPPPSPPTILLVVDRCMYCQLLFWRVQCDRGRNAPLDDAAYMSMWRKWERMIPPVSLIFFCSTPDIQQTMARVQRRAHLEELGVTLKSSMGPTHDHPVTIIEEAGGLTLSYQEELLRKHKEWFTAPRAWVPEEGPPEGIPCVHIDTMLPYHQEEDALRVLADVMARAIAEWDVK